MSAAAAQRARCGGISPAAAAGAGTGRARRRCRPRSRRAACPCELTSALTNAGTPLSTQISTTARRCRTNAWWKEIGPASSRTVRKPITSLPSGAAHGERLERSPARAQGERDQHDRDHGAERARRAPAGAEHRGRGPGAPTWTPGRSARDQPDPEARRRQLERDGLAGDELVERCERAVGHRPQGRANRSFRAACSPYCGAMDLDAYVHTHRHDVAAARGAPRRRPRSGAEADELVDLYQEVATHLSVIRSTAPDPAWSPTSVRCWRMPGPAPAAPASRAGRRRATSSYAASRRRSTGLGAGGSPPC